MGPGECEHDGDHRVFSCPRRNGLVGETNHLRTTFVTLSDAPRFPAQKHSSETLNIPENPATSDSLSPDPEGGPSTGRRPKR